MRFPGLVVLASFLLAATAGPASATLPFVRHIGTSPDPACAGLATTLVIDGEFPDGCGQVLSTEQFGAERVVVSVRPRVAADTACTGALQPWRRVFNLGDLPAGPRSVDVEIRVVPVNANDPPQIVVEPFAFTVQSCGPDSLPYVGSIGVTAAPPCSPATVVPCPGDSLGVCIRGTFPNDCFRLVSVELLPSPIAGPRPEPPIVRLVVDDGACSGRACVLGRFSWQATATLPPLPSGSYGLHVELALVSCTEDIDPSRLHRTIVPFRVFDCGPPPGPCLRAGFIRSFDPRVCDAEVSPGHPAVVGFGLGSDVALAGLEGQFDLQPTGLRIEGIEAVGPAVGLQLTWSATPSGGAHFVLFGDDPGEVIPGGQPPETVEILRLRVTAPAGTTPPERTSLGWSSLLGADANGNGVPECPTRATDERLRSFILCSQRPCDFNHDGVRDVRDLVLMVRALNEHWPVLPGTVDCNDDGSFTLDDVICCATKLLREHCPDCPADTGGRPEPGINMTFGAPVFGEHGVDVPLRIRGAERIGGAKLTLRVPTDRYDVSAELLDPNHRWLHLDQAGDGQLVLGLILTAAETTPGPGVLDLTLHFEERSGQAPGGVVALEGTELSGLDGVRLIVDAGRPEVELGGAPHLVLGESRPNPTSGVARFTVTLDRPGNVDVAIYDVSGRRVTTLLTGLQGVGTREVRWDGRDLDGREMPGGLYFYRGSAGGQVVARKLVLLRAQ